LKTASREWSVEEGASMMRVVIVYDSSTGTTKVAAEQMGDVTRAAGY